MTDQARVLRDLIPEDREPAQPGAEEAAIELGPEVDFRETPAGTEPVGSPAARAAAACESFAPLVKALSEAGELHDWTAHVLRSAVLQPDARLLPRWLEQLRRRLNRIIEVPDDLYEQWAQAVLAEGPDRGFLALETYRRAALPAYQQTLRILRATPLGPALREHISETLSRDGGRPSASADA